MFRESQRMENIFSDGRYNAKWERAKKLPEIVENHIKEVWKSTINKED